jgi:hypothetical protein
MSCDRYWREGVLLVEQGLPDPHRETCDDCKRAHAARDELVRALPHVGPASAGRPDWQAHVWARIARDQPQPTSRRAWFLGGAAVATIAILVVVFGWGRWRDEPRRSYVTMVGVEKGAGTRGDTAAVGDRIRVELHPADELRVYRRSELVFRCGDTLSTPGCTHDARGSVGRYTLASDGDYTVVILTKPIIEPAGSLDRDLAAIVTAGGKYRIERELSVR